MYTHNICFIFQHTEVHLRHMVMVMDMVILGTDTVGGTDIGDIDTIDVGIGKFVPYIQTIFVV